MFHFQYCVYYLHVPLNTIYMVLYITIFLLRILVIHEYDALFVCLWLLCFYGVFFFIFLLCVFCSWNIAVTSVISLRRVSVDNIFFSYDIICMYSWKKLVYPKCQLKLWCLFWLYILFYTMNPTFFFSINKQFNHLLFVYL